MSTILESVKILLGQADARSKLSQMMDVDPAVADNAVRTAVPVLIKALADRADLDDGPQTIRSIVELDDGTIVADVPHFLEGRKRALGNGMLDAIFGQSRADAAVDIAAVGRVAPAAVRKMLPMLMPVVVGIVAKRRKDRVLTDDELVAFLDAERSKLEHAARAADQPVVEVAQKSKLSLGGVVSLRWVVIGFVVAVALAWALSILAGGQSDALGLGFEVGTALMMGLI